MCERAGAGSIVCHLREDRRHIQERDVERLKRAVTTRLNLEMSIAPAIVDVALAITPHQVTLVPERRAELTTEGGLDAEALARRLGPIVKAFHRRRIDVSLFVDPIAGQVTAARDIGAMAVELHTGRYANARTGAARTRELGLLQQAARRARQLGLAVAAGHGLDYRNVAAVRRIPHIEELNIGFAIVARAVWVGLAAAVTEMARVLRRP